MADFTDIIQEINTNLPDNNTQSITAEKLRTTLIDLTTQIDTVQDDFETSINNELDNFVVDSLSSSDTDKSLSANQGRELKNRSFTLPFVGNGNTLVSYSIYCYEGHKYRIYPSKTDIDFTGITYTTSSYICLGFYNYDENIENPITLYSRGCNNLVDPYQEYYDITAQQNGYLSISIRAAVGEKVKFIVTDITESTEIYQYIDTNVEPIQKDLYGDNVDASNVVSFYGAFYNIPLTDETHNNVSYVNISSNVSYTTSVGQTRLANMVNSGYDLILITANDEWDSYVTFTNTAQANIGNNKTLAQLLSNGSISQIHTDTAAFLVPAGTTKQFIIPSDCINIVFTGINLYQTNPESPTESPYRTPVKVVFSKSSELGLLNDFELLQGEVENLKESEEQQYEYVKVDPRHYPFDNYVLELNGNIISGGQYYSVCIPLYEAKSVKIKSMRYSTVRFNFLTEPITSGTCSPASGYSSTYYIQGVNDLQEYTVPQDAKYLYFYIGSLSKYIYSGYCPEYVELKVKKYTCNSSTVGFEIGDIGIDGNVHNNPKYAVSGFIDCNRGFYFKVFDEYKVQSASLYDMAGNLVSFKYLPDTADNTNRDEGYYSYPYALQNYSFYSIAYCIPYQVRIVVTKRDGSNIDDVENIVKSFVYLNDKRLHLETPEFNTDSDMTYYSNFRNRIRQLSSCVFNPQGYMPTTTANPSYSLDMNQLYFRKNQYRAGVGYSSNYQYSKSVGQEVSLRTYLSAISDKFSVVYTENLTKNNSDYGITYDPRSSTAAANYYGIVCSSLVGYALNLTMVYRADYWKDAKVPYTTIIPNVTGQTVKVGDLIWNTGHISVISEIYDDEQGNRKFIVWSEQTKPSPYICAITPEEFDERLAHSGYGTEDPRIQVMRYSNWETVNTPYNFASDTDINIDDFYTTNKIYKPLEDIQSFAGDYATFTKGSPIYFTVNIRKGYTRMEVLDSSNNIVDSVSISELSENNYYGNSYLFGFGKLNYTTNSLGGGLYTARLVDDDENISSETHFEIVEMTLNVTKEGSVYHCSISNVSSNATPYLLRREDEEGYNTTESGTNVAYEFLNGNETLVDVTWSITSSFKYIKLFCKGQYGVAVTKVNAYNI